MDLDLLNKTIKLCVVGTGWWGSQVIEASKLINRFELCGTINSKTSEEEKQRILREADLVYIAVDPEHQKEYVDYCINNQKHTICESPFLTTLYDRKEIYSKLKDLKYEKLFYVNYPYYLDRDYARQAANGITSESSFIHVKAYGPKFKDDFKKAKKFYSNQAIHLLVSIVGMSQINKFDEGTVIDQYTGEFKVGEKTYLFSWGWADEPRLESIIKGDNYSSDKIVIYDHYDQVVPLLLLSSDKIYNIYLDDIKYSEIVKNNPDLNYLLSISSYLLSSTSEYLSDIFTEHDDTVKLDIDPVRLFFNGGLVF